MATTTAIPSGTGAATAAADITVASGASIQVWTTPRLGKGETVTVWRTDGASIVEEVVEGNNTVTLTNVNGSTALNGPITVRLIKSVTAVATTVLYDS